MSDPSPPLHSPSWPNPNEAVTAFLKDYVAFAHEPRYAVLLDGAWGSGKSHLIKAFLEEVFRDRSNQFIYVSLYGIASTAELDDALFAAAYPLLETRTAKLATGVGKAVLKHLKYELPELKANDVLKRLKASVYVFDDLERVKLPVDQVMGYINQLVEHEGKKVIVLANQDKLEVERGDYNVRREKVVGRVFAVRPDLHAAVHSFVQRIDNRVAHPFLQDRLPLVCDIFEQSEIENLRILQQAMWDFERLCACLNDVHPSNPDAMNAMLRLVLPLAIEYKAGRLTDEDITGRQRYAMRLSNEAKSRLETAKSRYTGSDIYDTILSNDILAELLVNGRVAPDALAASLERSRFFLSPSAEPAWTTVWHWQSRESADVENAIGALTAQIDARAFSISGEILHVFGIQLFLASAQLIPRSRQAVVDAAKTYIDALLADDRLEPAHRHEFVESGYGGLGFLEGNSPELGVIHAYLGHARAEQAAQRLPKQARDLLTLMATDLSGFRRALVVSAGGGEFYNVPILAQIAPADFVGTIKRLPADGQRSVMDILRVRYDSEALAGQLAGEREWLGQVGAELTALARKETSFAAYRLNTFVRWFIHEPLARAEAALKAKGEAAAPAFPAPDPPDQA